MKQEFFELIKSGLKTLELRIVFQLFVKISKGDHVMFKSSQGDSTEVEITSLRQYKNIDEVLLSENISNLALNMSDKQIQKISTTLFKKSDIQEYGLLMFELKK